MHSWRAEQFRTDGQQRHLQQMHLQRKRWTAGPMGSRGNTQWERWAGGLVQRERWTAGPMGSRGNTQWERWAGGLVQQERWTADPADS